MSNIKRIKNTKYDTHPADPYHCLNYCVKTQHLLQTIDIYHVNIVYLTMIGI